VADIELHRRAGVGGMDQLSVDIQKLNGATVARAVIAVQNKLIHSLRIPPFFFRQLQYSPPHLAKSLILLFCPFSAAVGAEKVA
jgi:hypothetical protein